MSMLTLDTIIARHSVDSPDYWAALHDEMPNQVQMTSTTCTETPDSILAQGTTIGYKSLICFPDRLAVQDGQQGVYHCLDLTAIISVSLIASGQYDRLLALGMQLVNDRVLYAILPRNEKNDHMATTLLNIGSAFANRESGN